ncbi:MAG TPA: carboxypeptidase-like regulatory domain-containing protein [Candidatus Eremiobacteraceae bacterium]|nr:carboxypeptidase-like regulatory domain-containing protein [Candidatus Eremiobacteraceae bacterium]
MMTRNASMLATASVTALLLGACTNPTTQGDYGALAGVVSSSAGPVAGAQVCVAVVDCATTAADGTYKISTVPGDPTGVMETVTASATGYQPFTTQVHITSGQQTPLNITLVHV